MLKTASPTVLITGASSGIGLELARLCAADGHNLILAARSHERLQAICTDLSTHYNIQAIAMEQDLSKPGAAGKLVDKLDGRQVDILINNAGFGLGGKFVKQDPTKLTEMMNLNITTLTELSRLLAPAMAKRGSGRILNVASTAAFLPGPFMAVYYATKAYVLSFSRALAYELKPSGVTVTILCPGPTKTHFATAAKVEGSRLFRSRNLMLATEVARQAYGGMMAGRGLVIPGFSNKLSVAVLRLLPNGLVLRAVNAVQGGGR